MLKCPDCGSLLEFESVEEFEYGFDPNCDITELDSCKCPNCEKRFYVRRTYSLTKEYIKNS